MRKLFYIFVIVFIGIFNVFTNTNLIAKNVELKEWKSHLSKKILGKKSLKKCVSIQEIVEYLRKEEFEICIDPFCDYIEAIDLEIKRICKDLFQTKNDIEITRRKTISTRTFLRSVIKFRSTLNQIKDPSKNHQNIKNICFINFLHPIKSVQSDTIFIPTKCSSEEIIEMLSQQTEQKLPTLEEIYKNHENKEEILKEAQRTDRVIVAVIDTGIDYKTPELAYKTIIPEHQIQKPNETYEYNQMDRIESISSYNYSDTICPNNIKGHGTGVAGIITKDTNDIAILSIGIMTKKACRQENHKFNSKNMIDGIKFAHQQGARIFNISFGIRKNKTRYKLMKELSDSLFIISAGNKGENLDLLEDLKAFNKLPNVTIVASVNKDNQLSSFSNYGKNYVDVAALGEVEELLRPGGKKSYGQGTSFATPAITSAVAKVSFANPKLLPQEILSIIYATTDKEESLQDKIKSGGVLNEERAIALAKSI